MSDVSRQLVDARSVLARLWDDTRRYPDLEWVRTEIDDALTILSEATAMFEERA